MSINYLGTDKGIKLSKASDSLGNRKDGVKLENGLGSFPLECCILILGRVVEKIRFYPLQMGGIFFFIDDASVRSWKYTHGDVFSLKVLGEDWGVKYSMAPTVKLRPRSPDYQNSSFMCQDDVAREEDRKSGTISL